MATNPVAGVKPIDYTDPPGAYNGWQLVVTAGVCMGFSTTAIALRLWTRRYVVSAVGLDDCLIFLAWICATTLAIADIVQCGYGTGTHLWEIELPRFETFLKLQMVVGNFYTTALPLAKISILAFYLRVFEQQRTFKILVYATAIFVAAYATSGIAVIIFSCNPIAASWDLALAALPTTTCVNRPKNYLAQASLNIISDIFIVLLPAPLVWKLQMPLRQRLSLIGVFSLGFVVCVVSIIRLQSIAQLLKSNDLTWDTTSVLIWSTIEAHVLIICACGPTLRPLFTRFLPGFFSTQTPTSRNPRSGTYPVTGRSQVLHGGESGTGEEDSYELYNQRGAEKGTTTIVGRGRSGSLNDSQEDILGPKGVDDVYVTKTVEVYRG